MTDSPPTASQPPASAGEPPQTEPSQTEPSQTEPSQTEPSQTEPSQTEPSQAEPPQPEPSQTYEAAAARVEEIIRRLDSGDASLNETLALVAEGKGLIELCARELAAVGDALEELRLDELVSRLEDESGS